MRRKEKQAIEFLKYSKNSSFDIDINECLEELELEIQNGLEDKTSSLSMIPTYLNSNINTKSNKKVILIDAGGSNLRIANGQFDKDMNPIISNCIQTKMLGTDKKITKKEFYDSLYSLVSPYLEKENKISFCFSYNTTINSNLKGTLNSFSKEIAISNIIGTNINNDLEKKIKKESKCEVSSIMLNDTVACALGAKALFKEKYSSYLGLIYGTGMNICYEEESINIKKITKKTFEKMLINTECGDYNKLPKGRFDLITILNSSDDKKGLAEKHCSGLYLPKIIYYALLIAKDSGLIKSEIREFELKEISDFLNNTHCSRLFMKKDKLFIKYLIMDLIKRAAKIVAILTMGFAKRIKIKENEKLCIACEGTTFEKLPYFQDYFKEYLKQLDINYDVVVVKDANLIGSLYASFIK